ncbi:MAG TPA: diiron oxygenase [Chryseolinea sp.]|nr:diiron oxygenase [Chryseolinea sp.]HPM30225.1 diiron oxygenase [Chryseolinea sp.]
MISTVIAKKDEEKVLRLIHLSNTKALLPDKYVPWDDLETDDSFLPESLVSLAGHELYESLSFEQKRELGRFELAQIVYSYAWAEGVGCLIFNNRLVGLEPDSLEYKYLIKMSIEEYRHQEMFIRLIDTIKGKTFIMPSQRLFMTWYMRNAPQSHRFLSILTVEIMADTYGKLIQDDKRIFRPVRKASQLHHIEEGRHIYYTKIWLSNYFDKASLLSRTTYSIVVMCNLLLLKSLYVREEIFEMIGVKDPKQYAREARKELHKKFSKNCIGDAVSLVKEFNGFNFITRPLWKYFLNVSV